MALPPYLCRRVANTVCNTGCCHDISTGSAQLQMICLFYLCPPLPLLSPTRDTWLST